MMQVSTTNISRITRDSLAASLRHGHNIEAGGDGGFSDDGESAIQMHAGKTLKPAAVLILVINQPIQPTVLFTQRTAHLTDHAGQISFPGGRVEVADRDPFHTALRETEEETGVDANRIEIIGTIPQYTTGTGYLITPVVGWLEPPITYRPDPTEVEECFEVPFEFLTDISPINLKPPCTKAACAAITRCRLATAISGVQPPACWSVSRAYLAPRTEI